VQDVIKTIPAPADELTPRQAAFVAEYVANGGNATKALRTVTGETKPFDRMDAHRMLRVPAVSARVAELRRVAADALDLSISDLALKCFEMANTSVADLMPVETHACRVCHSLDGTTPGWETIEEFTLAVEAWDAAKDTPKPRPRPNMEGGVTYQPFGQVNAACVSCGGRGVPTVRIVPSDEQSQGARMLYAGVTLRDDGTVERVLVEDRSKWQHMLHQLLGAYAPTKVEGRHLHAHVHKQAPDDRKPMSVDDAIAELELIS
jgi:hypothetical protein